MSETTRIPLKPVEIRRRAYRLIKQCWLTVLIAAVLMSLFSWIGDAVENHGVKLALNVYNARMDTFYAETEPPTVEAAAALNAMLAGQGIPEWTDDIEYASLYDTREWLAQYDASNLYDDAFRPWEWLGYGIDFLDQLFSCIIAVGLFQGLLSALRIGECTPHCLLSGWSRASTACGLAIKTTLRILGWSLLPLLVGLSLAYAFGDWGEVIGTFLMLGVVLWATLHYALAEVHLADDPDGTRTATDCLHLAVDDADLFGVWQMCKVLWPVAALLAVNIIMVVVPLFVPALQLPALVFGELCGMLNIALQYTCYICIYDEIRQRIAAAEAAVPANEGLARARALAAGESPEE